MRKCSLVLVLTLTICASLGGWAQSSELEGFAALESEQEAPADNRQDSHGPKIDACLSEESVRVSEVKTENRSTDSVLPVTAVSSEAVDGREKAVVDRLALSQNSEKRAEPLERVPALLGLTPYVTTMADVEKTFGEKAHFYEDDRLGKRHIVTGEDFGCGVQSLLISYTVKGWVSDLYARFPGEHREALLETLKKQTQSMDPSGVWLRSEEGDRWVTKTALISVGKVKKDGNFSLEYGASARKALETRAWLEEAPEERCPHFAGLLIGWSELPAVKAVAKKVKACTMTEPIRLSDGSTTYTLKGACFGLPGEVKSYVWFGADTDRLIRLEILSEDDPVGFESVLPALKKRFREVDHNGLFETVHAPSRNIWTPRIQFDPQGGRLIFSVETDGVRRAELDYEAALVQKKAREMQAERVDRLFD